MTATGAFVLSAEPASSITQVVLGSWPVARSHAPSMRAIYADVAGAGPVFHCRLPVRERLRVIRPGPTVRVNLLIYVVSSPYGAVR